MIILSLLFVTFWQRGPGTQLGETVRQMEVDMNIQDFSLVQGKEGRPTWKLLSDSAGYLKDEGTFILKNPVITYYSQDNSLPLTIRASEGRVFQQENRIDLWPDVQAVYNEIIVNSHEATYFGGENSILLKKDVVFSGNNMLLESPEARIMLDEEKMTASGGIKTFLH
ncbi:MAG: LPS export ABC transporter periplasmic protein LptC [Desulfonatronovibrio sp.]